MAKLQRVTGKVFGGSAPLNQIGQFGSALAGNPTNTQDVATIQALDAYSKGWGSAVVTSRNFPPIEEVTGVLKTIRYQACYCLQEGIPEYDINTEYSNTSIVKSINGNELSFYISLANNNIGNSLSNTTYWTKAVFVGSSAIGVPQITLNYGLVNAPENCVWLEGALDNIPGYSEDAPSDYPNLYGIYGTAYNDENTPAGKYKLPDFRGKAIWGGNTAGYLTAGAPNITGEFTNVMVATNHTDDNKALRTRTDISSTQQTGSGGTTRYLRTLLLNASYASSVYGGSDTIQPPAVKVRVYTRYQ